jgi:hypothetical protein
MSSATVSPHESWRSGARVGIIVVMRHPGACVALTILVASVVLYGVLLWLVWTTPLVGPGELHP